MDIFDKKPIKLVLSSINASSKIDTSNDFEYGDFYSFHDMSDFQNYITKHINPISVVYAVIILEIDEYDEIKKILNSYDLHNLAYNFVLIINKEKLSTYDPKRYTSVSEFSFNNIGETELNFILAKSFSLIDDIYLSKSMEEEYLNRLLDTKQDQEDLINIGKALSSEKDMPTLLRLILFLSKKITGADAGSIYLVEENTISEKVLRFKYSHTFSREIPLEEFVIDLNKKSISGYVAITGEVVNIENAYEIPDTMPYSFNSSFDKKHDYITKSILAVPMRNHVDEIIGVIQLINSKEDFSKMQSTGNEAFEVELNNMEDFNTHVVSFNPKYDNLLEAIAGQAAVAIEKNKLIEQIQFQFEEFVKASVTAIESRDPATSGHSFRVAEICTALAKAVNEVDDGYLSQFHFSENDIKEIELAALLHDFGKVYIDLAVFKKEKKLFPRDRDNLILRLNYLYRFIELQYFEKEKKIINKQSKENDQAEVILEILKDKNRKLNRIKEIKEIVYQLNEPRVIDEDPQEILKDITNEISEIECLTIDGEKIEILTDYDRLNLTIRRGSLNPEERKVIESHVDHTYSFVSKIPWPPEYKNIPQIALQHHEKLNGTGYPKGLKGRENTLLQSRIMAIADIYDALAASDRPYKKAVPLDRVIKILKEEADRDILDKDLVHLFLEKKIYNFNNNEI